MIKTHYFSQIIEAALEHREVMKHLNYFEILPWLRVQPDSFRHKMIIVAVHFGAQNHPFSEIISHSMQNYFKELMNCSKDKEPELPALVKAMLHDAALKPAHRIPYLYSWSWEFYAHYSQAQQNKERMLDVFINNLFIEKETDKHALLRDLLSSDLEESDKSKVREAFLQKYPLRPEQLAAVLSNFTDKTVPSYQVFLQTLCEHEPENQSFKLMLNFLNIPQLKQFDFILQNPNVLNDAADIPTSFCRYAVRSFTYDQRTVLLAKYTSNAFPQSKIFSNMLFTEKRLKGFNLLLKLLI